jgi:hypothetical protein
MFITVRLETAPHITLIRHMLFMRLAQASNSLSSVQSIKYEVRSVKKLDGSEPRMMNSDGKHHAFKTSGSLIANPSRLSRVKHRLVPRLVASANVHVKFYTERSFCS